MLHQSTPKVKLRCACCLHWLDPDKAYIHEGGTHALCLRCLPKVSQNAKRIARNVYRCPAPPASNMPTIGQIRQMLGDASPGAVMVLLEAYRRKIPASIVREMVQAIDGGAA